MDKRIAISMMAALLLLVVTAAYAPNLGTTTDTETAGDDQTTLQTLDKKLNTVLENQKLILEQIKGLKTAQDDLTKDVTYIRSKTH
ncbi:MAG: hypothetical protein JW889_10485 [Verrucomicrobia bacterium]|nr:hypothetical protein [Verrucomicrobiota bacterium]